VPRIEASCVVPVDPELAFDVSQTHGELRLRWDPFIHSQHLIDADRPAKGVRTATVSRHRLRMVSEYVSFRRPTQVGMKMVEGPWFFESFGGGWSFAPADGGTRATWRYTFTVRPSWLARVADPIGIRLLRKDIEARIAAFARACEDPVVLDAVRSGTPDADVTN
jgi:hypothetical protein